MSTDLLIDQGFDAPDTAEDIPVASGGSSSGSTTTDLEAINSSTEVGDDAPLDIDQNIDEMEDDEASRSVDPASPDATQQTQKPGDPSAAAATAALSRTDWADYGLTEKQARDLDAKGGLSAVMDAIDRRFMNIGNQVIGGPPTQPAQQHRLPEQQPQQQQQQNYQQPQQQAGPLKLSINPQEYDENIANQFSGLVDYANQQSAELQQVKQQLNAVLGDMRQRETSAYANRMDTRFNDMGDDYAEVFGKGSLDDLPKGSPQRKARTDVDSAMIAYATGLRQTGQPVPPESVLFEKALRLTFGDKIRDVETKKATTKATEQYRNVKGQFISKPTNTNGKPKSPEEQAKEFIRTYRRDHGMN